MISAAVEKVAALRSIWKTADVWEIIDRLGICADHQDLSPFDCELKGYCFFAGRFFIVIDENLPEFIQELIAWHELGHILLDPELLIGGQVFYDRSLDSSASRTEMRANYFAAEGHIDDDRFLELAYAGCTVQGIAAELKVPRDLVLYKAQIMREYGHPLELSEKPDPFCLQDDIYG